MIFTSTPLTCYETTSHGYVRSTTTFNMRETKNTFAQQQKTYATSENTIIQQWKHIFPSTIENTITQKCSND